MKNILIVAALFLGLCQSANATLIDNGSYTTDTVSGLDWLDITASVDRSYSDVSTQFGAGGDFEGYRYATQVELESLKTEFRKDVNSYFLDLLGCTGGCYFTFGVNIELVFHGMYTHGMLYATDTSLTKTLTIGSFVDEEWFAINSVDIWGNIIAYQPEINSMGSFLVRPTSVPEPATIALMGLGLAGLGFSRRRKAKGLTA